MKHSPSSFSLILQVGAIMCATLLVVLIFFRIRPSVLPPLTFQESVHAAISKNAPATVMIVDDAGIIGGWVMIDSTMILTSRHLVEIGKRYGIRFGDNDIVWWSPVALHPDLDLALVLIEKSYPNTAQIIASSSSLQAGDFVIAGGVLPQTQSFTYHFGIISDINATLMVPKQMRGLILTDIPFRGAYSGGPLFNLRGELIGIHTAFGVDGNVGWSTPIDQGLIGDWKKVLN